MSYDLEVWSVHAIQPTAFRDPEKWEHPDDSEWVRSGSSWQILISSSSKVLPEDVPEEIAQLLPGIKFLTSIGLEGRRTNEAMQLLKSTSTHLAKSLHGVILDKQEDTTVTPTGVKRFVPPSKQETFSVLRFSWWFLGSPLLTNEGRERFLALLERLLPEALPRRYGTHEPPQHIYAETGKVHLLRFMGENLHDFTVWYAHRPVVSLYLGHPNPVGASKLGFRTNHMEIEVESAVLAQPGWADNLRQFWRQVSQFLTPFYGEVRTLGGRQRRGGTVYASFKAEAGLELTKSWWWRGVPKKIGGAVVLGEAYQKLWPAFVAKASMQERMAFASTADWVNNRDLSEDLGTPPHSISMRREAERSANQEYPNDWPFGEPFDPPRPPLNKSLMRKLRDLFPALVLMTILFSVPVSLAKENVARSLNLCALCAPISATSALSPSLPAPSQNEKPDWCKPLPRPEFAQFKRMLPDEPWFEVYRVAPGTFAIYEPHQSEETISYLIVGQKQALLFDTGMGIADIKKIVSRLTSRPVVVLNSHTHDDHVGGNWQSSFVYGMDTAFTRENARGSTTDAQAEIARGEICGDLPKGFDPKTYRTKPWHISFFIHDGFKINLGGRTVEVIATPGHTPDAIALIDRANKLLFTGDTYYPAPIWLYRPETDLVAYQKSISQLAALAPEVKTALGAHNIPVAAPEVLPALVQAFADLQAGKATCKPAGPGRQLCAVDKFSFLLRAAP